jgi:phage-related protein
MSPSGKPLIWLHGEIATPPFSESARIEAGYLLRKLQRGLNLSMPHARPMPAIGPNCHELRIVDENVTWRIIFRIYSDAILILEVFEKKASRTPIVVINTCKSRLKRYEQDIK